MAAYKIQRWFTHTIVDIKYKYARSRVNKFYDEIIAKRQQLHNWNF